MTVLHRAALSLSTIAALAATSAGAQQAQPSLRQARELRRIPAAEARQAVAADERYLYAIDNRRIGKYDKATGRRVGGWEGPEAGPVQHLNSGVVVDGRLYAAHSNYPERPMVSSIEIFDTQTMRHVGSHSFGIHAGSATWIDSRGGDWWVTFANYENRGGEPGRGVEWTVLERYDGEWRRKAGWVLPPELVAKLRPYSVSGGVWNPDGQLYLTGHDAAELYVVRLPQAGAVLELVEIIRGTHQGQGIARDPARPGVIYGIDRAKLEIVVMELPRR